MSENCEHKFVVLHIVYSKQSEMHGSTYKRVTTYFCEKCTEKKEVVKQKQSVERPYWYEA